MIEKFKNHFPDRFLNVGVAEQNMTSIAAGLASEGYHVFTYSIANFPTFRCAEQMINIIGYSGKRRRRSRLWKFRIFASCYTRLLIDALQNSLET